MCFVGREHGKVHGFGLLPVDPRLHGTRRCQKADAGRVAEFLADFLHRHLLHVDEGNAQVALEVRNESVRRIAGNDQHVAAVLLEATGAVEHRERRVGAVAEQARRTVGDLRILLDRHLEVFLVVARGRRLHDLVVEVDRGRRPEAADHAHLEGLRTTRKRREHGALCRIAQKVEDGKAFRLEIGNEARHLTAGRNKELRTLSEKLVCRLQKCGLVFGREPRATQARFGILHRAIERRQFVGEFEHFGRPVEKLHEEFPIDRHAEKTDAANARRFKHRGKAPVKGHHRHFDFRLHFVEEGFATHVGHHHFVATRALQFDHAFERRDFAVAEFDSGVGRVLAHFDFARHHVDANVVAGADADEFRFERERHRRIDSGRKADRQTLHDFLLFRPDSRSGTWASVTVRSHAGSYVRAGVGNLIVLPLGPRGESVVSRRRHRALSVAFGRFRTKSGSYSGDAASPTRSPQA